MNDDRRRDCADVQPEDVSTHTSINFFKKKDNNKRKWSVVYGFRDVI